MNKTTLSASEADAALSSVAAARARVAEAGLCPPWRHAAFGLLMTTLITTASFPLEVQFAGIAVAMGMMVMLLVYDRRRYGFFINGYRRGATRPVVAVLSVGMAALLVTALFIRERQPGVWAHIALAAGTFAFATGASVWWARAFRRELKGEAR